MLQAIHHCTVACEIGLKGSNCFPGLQSLLGFHGANKAKENN
jgi:hypothetical protein